MSHAHETAEICSAKISTWRCPRKDVSSRLASEMCGAIVFHSPLSSTILKNQKESWKVQILNFTVAFLFDLLISQTNRKLKLANNRSNQHQASDFWRWNLESCLQDTSSKMSITLPSCHGNASRLIENCTTKSDHITKSHFHRHAAPCLFD